MKPFKDDPAKQDRFERFLKEKYQGGLRTTQSAGAINMSEAARALERLDFEAAAEAIEKGNWGKETKISTQKHITEYLATGGMQFTSGGSEVCFRCFSSFFLLKFEMSSFYFAALNLNCLLEIVGSRRLKTLMLKSQRKCTQNGKNINGVLHQFYASVLILLILTWGRYFSCFLASGSCLLISNRTNMQNPLSLSLIE